MKKLFKILIVILAGAFAAIQFYRPTLSNPPILPGQPIEESAHVPAEIQMVLSRSCNDCHSNKTLYPWYSKVSPFSWFLAGHIEEGRAELNFSEWDTYPASKKSRKLEEICEMVEAGAMPLPSYLWIHREARLSYEQSRQLCYWAQSERTKLGVP